MGTPLQIKSILLHWQPCMSDRQLQYILHTTAHSDACSHAMTVNVPMKSMREAYTEINRKVWSETICARVNCAWKLNPLNRKCRITLAI